MTGTRRETFEVAGSPNIELTELYSGEAIFVEGEAGLVEVEVSGENAGDFVVEQDGERILLRAPKGRFFSKSGGYEVRVKTPPVAELSVNLASADADVRVAVDRLDVNSASGDVRVRDVTGRCGFNTASGDVRLGEVGGECGIRTASGDVHVASAGGELGVRTASGDVRVKHASGEVGVHSASGDLVVERYEGRDLGFDTKSGDARVGLPPGRDVDLRLDTLTGDIDVQFDGNEDGPEGEPGEEVSLSVRTISGDITLFKARD